MKRRRASTRESSAAVLRPDGKPAAGVLRVLKFSETYQAQFEDTRLFGEWLETNELLETRMARADLEDGQIFHAAWLSAGEC